MREYAPPGMKRVAPGLFETPDGSELHFFPYNFCVDVGIQPTEQNMQLARISVEPLLLALAPDATLIDFNEAGSA